MKYKCAGIVTYQPDIERLNKNIEALYDQVDHLIIVDNGSKNIKELQELVVDKHKIEILSHGNNEGIAWALNKILELAERKGYTWCLLMDQDSICSKNIIAEYAKHLNDDNIAILAPYIVDEYKTNLEQYKQMKLQEKSECIYAITSGTFLNINIWKKVGKFIEDMFIDGVDTEFSYRVREKGYKINRINKCYILHQQGNKTEKTHIYRIYKDFAGNISIKPAFRFNYSTIRWYYMARNNYAIIRRYSELNGRLKPILSYMMRFMSVLLLERNKKEVWSAIRNGYRDGKKYYLPKNIM